MQYTNDKFHIISKRNGSVCGNPRSRGFYLRTNYRCGRAYFRYVGKTRIWSLWYLGNPYRPKKWFESFDRYPKLTITMVDNFSGNI